MPPARGARVALVGLEPDRLRALADDLGPLRCGERPMCATARRLRSAIDDCAQAMGCINIVVANAGIAAYGTVRQADESPPPDPARRQSMACEQRRHW